MEKFAYFFSLVLILLENTLSKGCIYFFVLSMGFVETVRNAVNSFLQGKMNNSLNGSAPFFSNRTNLGTAELKAFLKTSFHSYATTLSIGEKNTVISRSIDMLHEAIQYVDIVDDQGKELKN